VTEPAGPAIPRTRPLGVALIAIFLVLDAAVTIAEVAGLIPPELARGPLQDIVEVAPALQLAVAGLEILAALGLWRGSWRAWVLAMLLVGISLIVDLYLYISAEPRYLRLVIDVVIAFYLNQGLVREHFERRQDADPLPGETSG
jgi:hypothetical protein